MLESLRTIVYNIMDDRCKIYELPPDMAVVAAFQECEHVDGSVESRLLGDYPQCKEYHRGFACGDWIAFKKERADVNAL
jgi:hypothetical protein